MAIIEYMPRCRRGEMDRCRILYDDEAKQILLKMCRANDPANHGTARITKNHTVSCRGMWQQFGFEDPEPKTRWSAYYDDSRQMIVIELRKPLVPAKGGKK